MNDLVVGRYRVPGSELEEIFTTTGGPGGQHANRSRTAVTLRFDVEASTAFPAQARAQILTALGKNLIVVEAGDSRSQWRNRRLARERLHQILTKALIPKTPRRRTRPSAASRERRLQEKRARSERKRLRRRPNDGE